MNRVGFAIAWVAVALASIAWVQPKVDFSGTWKFVEAKSDPPAVGRHPRSGTLRIEQTDTEFTVSASGDGTLTMIYKLDGSESVHKLGGGTVTATATWDGSKLAIRSRARFSLPQGDLAIDTREVYSLVGSVLTIASTGPLKTSGVPASTTTFVFTKQ